MLNLEDYFKREDIYELTEALKANSLTTLLDLCGNRIGKEVEEVLAEV